MKYKKNPAETILIVQPGSTFYLCLRKKGLHILFPMYPSCIPGRYPGKLNYSLKWAKPPS